VATVYVIHDPADRQFVESTLLTPLPSLGFDRWISSETVSAPSLEHCKATLVVVSTAAQQSEPVRREASRCLKSTQTVVPVQIDDTAPDQVASGMSALAKVDPGDAITRGAVPLSARLRSTLPGLLPLLDDADHVAGLEAGVEIPWSAEIFSDYLAEVMTRHDFNRGEALIDSLERHLHQRDGAYQESDAKRDLDTLRRKRQFRLIERYAKLMLQSGSKDLRTRRQLAQALIERGKFDAAIPILEENAKASNPGETEYVEAFGLLGRAFKQQYVNDPKAPSASAWLRRSFDHYISVYRDGPDNFWHGVNAASLLLRAQRDALTWADPAEARTIATQILKRWEERRAENEVWDFASRVEALVALDKFMEAEHAVNDYVTHPQMDAFEVSSTFRQFDEVLQLANVPAARPVYDKLLHAADRFRASGVTSTPPQREDASQSTSFPILIRVSDPSWSRDLPDFQISSRLGTVIAANASGDVIHTLLKDPVVVSIAESRPVVDVKRFECSHSLPFIRVPTNNAYRDSGGDFQERGDKALIAFIDDGIDVLHEAFTDGNGQSRIVAIWDQTDTDVGVPHPPGFDYGRYHSPQDIQQYVATSTVPATLGRNKDGHGTHVASIAAGRSLGSTFYGGLAPEAHIVLVITKDDGDVGYSKAHLDALTFIDTIATDQKKPVVVNVSKGMNAGSHDGTSELEIGFDEFARSGSKPGRVVVKSAGNERGTKGHAIVGVTPRLKRLLAWERRPQTFNAERIELWWSSADRLTFKLGSPGGDWSAPVSLASPVVSGTLQGGGPIHMQLVGRHPANGDSHLLIKIGKDRAPIQHGTWTLQIAVDDAKSGRPLHAWIARLGGEPSVFTDNTSDDVTLTEPGTATSVITVGAIWAVDPPDQPTLGEGSSCGPTRDGRNKPEVVAPGIGIRAARGGTATDSRVEGGTSMAAPHVAGAIALVLSRTAPSGRPLSANQIRTALMQKTQDFNGHFDNGQGYGIIDVAAFLAAF
jgi:endonuclease G